MLRDGKQIDPPDFYAHIISRANQSIYSIENEPIPEEINYSNTIIEKRGEMLETIELSSHRTDKQLEEVNKVRKWLYDLDSDQQLFNDIIFGTNLPSNSNYSVVDRLISEERKAKTNQKISLKKRISIEKSIEKEKENLRKASYTKSMITFSKDLIILQKEIHEAMKPENVLKNESITSIRFENMKKQLEKELEGRKETVKRLKKELKGATKLFNNNVEYHAKLEEELTKLENYLKIYQSKSSIEIIEKAKKHKFIESQWKQKRKELETQIKEIEAEINKYKNIEQSNLELTNLIYGNKLEIEKLKENFDEKVELINQEMKISAFVQSNAIQILEKEMINSLNYHRGIESKNSQTAKKMATTGFSKLFMKFSKDKKNCLNKFERTLRRNNLTYEAAVDGLNTFRDENRKALTDAMDQMINDLKAVIENSIQIFIDKFQFNDKKMKLQWKNQTDVLLGRKQRLSSQIMYRETDILINQSTYNIIEGVYLDVLQSFSIEESKRKSEKCQKIKDEIKNINNFIQKGSAMLGELSQKMQNSLKNKTKSIKKSSSMIVSLKSFQVKKQPIKEVQDKITNPVNDEITISVNNTNINKNEKLKPAPPKKEEKEEQQHSPRFQHNLTSFSEQKKKKEVEIESLPFSKSRKIDSKLSCSLPSVPPDLFLMKRKRGKQDSPRNIIKDNSPHFAERKPRVKRREKSRMEIEEARRASILSREPSKRTIQDIPKIPIIKNCDSSVINEIDATYSFTSDFTKKKKKNKEAKTKTSKEIVLANESQCNQRKNENDEFYCIRNNINVTKNNISDLPFSKRITQNKDEKSEDSSSESLKIPIKIEKEVNINVSAKVFNFSEMTLNNYSFKPTINSDKKLSKKELLRKVEQIIDEDQFPSDRSNHFNISASTSSPIIPCSNKHPMKNNRSVNNRRYNFHYLYDY